MSFNPVQFNGRWVGETQDCDMPAHIWEITWDGQQFVIKTRWEHEQAVGMPLRGDPQPDGVSFVIPAITQTFTALLLDSQHFVVPGWDTNDRRGGDGPAYDVVFSRPGIAELTAHEVWQRYRQALAADELSG